VVVDSQNVMNETRLLAFDYIASHLRRCGYEWLNRPSDVSSDDPPNNSAAAIRSICERLSERYAELSRGDRDGISDIPVSPTEELTGKFSRIIDGVFRGEVTWGRIFTLFAFGGLLAVECVRQQRPDQIGVVAEMLATYAQMHLADWVTRKGGWESCLQYIDDARTEERNLSKKNMLAGVGVALGAVALGIVILNR